MLLKLILLSIIKVHWLLVLGLLGGLISTSREYSLMDFSEFLIRQVIAVEQLLVMINLLSIQSLDILGILGYFLCSLILILLRFDHIVIDTKSLCVKLVLWAQEISTVVNEVGCSLEIRSSLDGSLGHIKIEALIGEFENLPIVIESFLLLIALLLLDQTSEDHDLLTRDLDGTTMDDSQLEIVSNVVDSLPHVLFDIECFYFLDKVKL